MKLIWVLFLLCLAVHAVPVARTGKTKGDAAPQQEVNVLMFGIIQFSQTLKYVYETTEGKMEKIDQILLSQEETLQKLGIQMEQAAEVEKQMKEVIVLLQAQMAEQQAQTRMTKDWLAGMEQEEAELQTKVRRLEMYVNSSAPGSITELQKRVEDQGYILRGLQELIQFEKENIDSQGDRLLKLQEMSEALPRFTTEIFSPMQL